ARGIFQASDQLAGSALGQGHRHLFLLEMRLVGGNNLGLTHTILIGSDGVEDYRSVRESRQTDSPFVVGDADEFTHENLLALHGHLCIQKGHGWRLRVWACSRNRGANS